MQTAPRVPGQEHPLWTAPRKGLFRITYEVPNPTPLLEVAQK